MNISDISKEVGVERINVVVGDEDVYIEVTSTSSPDYITAISAYKRACSKAVISGKDLFTSEVVLGEDMSEPTELGIKLECILLASLITGWGFDDELTRDSAATMLINSPKVRALVDMTSSSLGYDEDTKKKSVKT